MKKRCPLPRSVFFFFYDFIFIFIIFFLFSVAPLLRLGFLPSFFFLGGSISAQLCLDARLLNDLIEDPHVTYAQVKPGVLAVCDS